MHKHLQAAPSFVNGYILLLSVLVIGAVGSAIAVSLLLLGVGASRTSFTLQQSIQSRALANTCAEEGLERLRKDVAYAGGDTIILSLGQCSVTVLGSGNTNRTVQAESTVGEVTRYTEVEVSTVSPTMTITSWLDVDSL